MKCHYMALSQDRAHVTPYIITYPSNFVKRVSEILHCVNEFSSNIVGIWRTSVVAFGQEVQGDFASSHREG